MTAQDLIPAPYAPRIGSDRPDLSGMLSIGEPPSPGKNYPRKLPFFRAKPGRDDQWAKFAQTFNERYGVTFNDDGTVAAGPRAIPIYLFSNRVEDVLEIRYLAFGKDRLAARGDTNYTAAPQLFGGPEWVTAYPTEGDPTRFQISGPNDPLCLGGDHEIPTILEKGKPSGKPALAPVTTLYFLTAEVGSLLTPIGISTKSRKSRDRLLFKLNVLARTGTLTHWLMLLVVRPDRVRYKDPAGKSHTATAYTYDLVGPLKSLAEQKPLTIDDMKDEIDRVYQRGQLSTPTDAHHVIAPRFEAPQIEAPDEPILDGEIQNGDEDHDGAWADPEEGGEE